MRIVDLGDLTQPALIIPCTTGVVYRQQCGGTGCLQRQLEGALVPVNDEFLAGNHRDSLEYRLMSLFPEGNPGYVDQDIPERIQAMLDSSPFTRDIRIDRDRQAESVEAWLYVRVTGDLAGILSGFGEVGAVLTWPNSD